MLIFLKKNFSKKSRQKNLEKNSLNFYENIYILFLVNISGFLLVNTLLFVTKERKRIGKF